MQRRLFVKLQLREVVLHVFSYMYPSSHVGAAYTKLKAETWLIFARAQTLTIFWEGKAERGWVFL